MPKKITKLHQSRYIMLNESILPKKEQVVFHSFKKKKKSISILIINLKENLIF